MYQNGEGIWITAASSTQCKIVGEFPIGTELEIDELFAEDRTDILTIIDRQLLSEDYIRVTGEGTVVIKPGINTVTITNHALGKLEICKLAVDRFRVNPNHLFTFMISGGVGTKKVRPGYCTPPILVTPGSYTITEALETNYEIDPNAPGSGINVTPATALVSKNTLARMVTVAVPYAGPYGDEVRVDFYNRVRRGNVKVCKHITPGSADSFHGKVWDYKISVEGAAVDFVDGIAAEECQLSRDNATGLPIEYPVVQGDGTPTDVAVQEEGMRPGLGGGFQPPFNTPGPVPFGQYYVSDLSVQGHRGTPDTECTTESASYSPTGKHCFLISAGQGAGHHITWQLGPNTNTAHFTNTAGNTAVGPA
jgi:hypothetical protein